FMQMLAETGVAGTGMFLWFMGTLLWSALSRLRAGTGLAPHDRADLVGLLGGVLATLVYAVPNFPFHIVSLATTFWMMAGLLASFGQTAAAPATAVDPAPAPPPL